MAILGFELEEIAQLLVLMEANKLDQILIEEDDRFLRIRGPRQPKKTVVKQAKQTEEVTFPVARQQPRPKAIAAAPNPSVPKELPTDQVALVSPMVGMYYHSDKPGSPPFVRVGDSVSVGQTIGLIEAMKIFSEIPAEHGGTVVALPAKDGQLVQAGTPLIILRKG